MFKPLENFKLHGTSSKNIQIFSFKFSIKTFFGELISIGPTPFQTFKLPKTTFDHHDTSEVSLVVERDPVLSLVILKRVRNSLLPVMLGNSMQGGKTFCR